jgi:hypothetical protein
MRLDPSTLRDVSAFAVVLGVPLLVFLPRMKGGAEAFLLRVLISTGITWVCLIAWVYFIAVPVAKSLGVREKDMRIAVAHLVPYGFIPAALGSIVVAVIYLSFQYVRTKRRQRG